LVAQLTAGLRPPLALIAQHQRYGYGQQGRVWHSPRGGVWLSAALPWPVQPEGSASLALAASLGIVLQLERLGLRPHLKWPNDVLLDGRKLAGILPRLRWRGPQVRYAQLGVGINGVNRVPAGAISLTKALGPCPHPQAQPPRLAALVLRGLEWATANAGQAELVRREAEHRLWRPEGLEHQGERWSVLGLEVDGGLRLCRGTAEVVLQRCF
jgi:BirA family biotin operon repressor/biotin-[acetyl-CoA-carboxylase] ligase